VDVVQNTTGEIRWPPELEPTRTRASPRLRRSARVQSPWPARNGRSGWLSELHLPPLRRGASQVTPITSALLTRNVQRNLPKQRRNDATEARSAKVQRGRPRPCRLPVVADGCSSAVAACPASDRLRTAMGHLCARPGLGPGPSPSKCRCLTPRP